ncbi:glycogen synthase GlgA [bacterium]|nr:glycogen synthase GlgA [bacterium]
MIEKLKIALISSEVFPFAKTGGLADVAGALPKYLARNGHDVIVIMPKYITIDDDKFGLKDTGTKVTVKFGGKPNKHRLFVSEHIPGVKTFFIEAPAFYDRDELYGTPNGDYKDNALRFGFFAKAVLAALEAIGFEADILHCNDWQTGLVPIYLKEIAKRGGFLSKAKTLFTIHNIAYQGLFKKDVLAELGLSPDLFVIDGLEFWGKVSFIKGGILFSDAVSTVSHKYSQEIQTSEFGFGLEEILYERKESLFGIPNGIDPEKWDPATDEAIPAHYGVRNTDGKRDCKIALAAENGLKYSPGVPIIGMITRLAAQKGLDILSECIEQLVELGIQFVILGTGDDEYHRIFGDLKKRLAGKVGINILYDASMAQRIYAGSDIFLMPSRYEPCGLGQLISMRYGTVPLVRNTGGLSDTVTEFDPATRRGTGFLFTEYTAGALTETVKRALNLFKDKNRWKKLVRNALEYDSSWNRSSRDYIELYRRLL